jgi:hypothetical protein
MHHRPLLFLTRLLNHHFFLLTFVLDIADSLKRIRSWGA